MHKGAGLTTSTPDPKLLALRALRHSFNAAATPAPALLRSPVTPATPRTNPPA